MEPEFSETEEKLKEEEEEDDRDEKFHLFGRRKPVHSALGGGKSADVILWRNKQISAALLAGSTVIWLLFEWVGYRPVPFICHSLIFSLASLFLWSNLSFFMNKSPISFPEIVLSEDICKNAALLLIERCNKAIGFLWGVASGKDIKKFLTVNSLYFEKKWALVKYGNLIVIILQAIFALWFVSIFGSWFDFLTIVYIMFVMILTMPSVYEKHEDQVDNYALKAKAQLKKQYSQLDEKVLQKLPKVPFITDNKQH
ncbi:Reticulon-like protein B6 [Striga hermonthica]|uniref:Reticulon-like protein n=1 Tax=Striga hermonthica TaxID=68872 RepID=A0A9N7RS43_STRHE|nr:Reticulon-like protein B6 [Striga hermonthica]